MVFLKGIYSKNSSFFPPCQIHIPKTISVYYTRLLVFIFFSQFLVTSPISSFAQIKGIRLEQISTGTDTSLLAQGLGFIFNQYAYQFRDNGKIYTGSEFINFDRNIKGSPYLDDDQFLPTDIFFEDFLYKNIPTRLDLVSGQLVIQDYAKRNFLELRKEKVAYFIRNQNLFVRLVPDSSTNSILKEGIYEVLWDKKISLFLNRVKISGVPSGVGIQDNVFLEYDHYFLKIRGQFYPCDDMNTFIKIIPDNKEVMKEYIRTNTLNHKKDLKTNLVGLAKKYAEL